MPLERRFGHRTLTHSLLILGIVAVASYPLTWLQPLYWGCVVGGYGSHIAVEQYQRQIGTHGYDLELVASDNLTLERVVCRCPVVGLWKGGLVVLVEGKPRAVGKSETHHDLLPMSARLIEGEPLRVQSAKVEMQGRTLRWLLGKMDQRRVYFLNGEVQTGKVGVRAVLAQAGGAAGVLRLGERSAR